MPTALGTALSYGWKKFAIRIARRPLLIAGFDKGAMTRNSEPAETHRDAVPAVPAPEDADRDSVIAIFSHEIRNHIAPIQHAAALLRCSPLDSKTVLPVAALIERQVDGMARLVDELLAATRSRAFEPKLRHADTAVQTVVDRSVEIVEPLASARRQTLVTHMPAVPVRLVADERWLVQAVQNVLGNAVKYTDPGGRIEIEVSHDSVGVVIRIRDTGIGVAPTQLETIFNLHTQVVQPMTRPAAGGFGVGLHVAKWVIEAHGGSIHAASEGLGCGTTFVIRLPCRAAKLSPRSIPATPTVFEDGAFHNAWR
jgi:signal transduction histidine kinase